MVPRATEPHVPCETWEHVEYKQLAACSRTLTCPAGVLSPALRRLS